MSLSPPQKRAAADLYNLIDLVLRKRLPRLTEPFGLDRTALAEWRQHLLLLADDLRHVRRRSEEVLTTPQELFPDVPVGDEALEFAAVEYLPEIQRIQDEERAQVRLSLTDEPSALPGIEAGRSADGVVVSFSTATSSGPSSTTSGEDPLRPQRLEIFETEIFETENAPLEDDQPDLLSALTPPLEERQALFREGRARLERALQGARDRLLRWVQEEAPRFRA